MVFLRSILILSTLLLISIISMAQIKIEGISEKTRTQLLREVPQLRQRQVKQGDLDRAIRFLMQMKKFENVFVYKKRQETLIKALPTKNITQIVFSGNKTFSSSTLLKKIDLKKGVKFQEKELEKTTSQLKTFYKKNGFLNTSIKLNTKKKGLNGVHVFFNINESTPTLIQKIQVETANRELKKLLEKELSSQIQKVLSQKNIKTLKDDITSFFTKNNYINASISQEKINLDLNRTKANLVYYIQNPYTYSLSISSNKQESGYSIRRAINFKEFYRAGSNSISELTTRIKDFYLKRGYARAKITSTLNENQKKFTKKIAVQINEGHRIRIKNVFFQGSFSKDKSYYKNFLIQNSSNLLKQLYYSQKDLNTGLENLIIELQNQGYLKADINSSRIHYDKQKKRVDLFISLNEGPLTLIKDITFTGNTYYNSADLKKQLDLKKGQALIRKNIEKSLEKISDFYQKNGHLEMRFLNTGKNLVQVNSQENRASIEFKLHEGPPIIVNDILIQGQRKTKASIIMKELDFKKGDLLTPYLIKESKQRLRQTGLFRNITITTLEKNSSISRRTVLIQLQERPPGLFTAGVGVTNERKITGRGFLTLSYLNLDGTHRSTTFKMEGNRVISPPEENNSRDTFTENKIRLSYTEPYLFQSRTKGIASLSRSQNLPQDQEDTVLEKLSFNLSLSQFFSSKLKGTWNLIDISENKEFSIGDKNQNPTQINRIVFTGPSIELDLRNHPIYATKGTLSHLQIEYASPFLGSSSGITYIRSIASFIHYTSFPNSRWIWTNSIQGGHLKNLNPDSYVPYATKGFTLGGSNTIRGLEPQNRFPNNQFEFGLEEGQSLKLKTESSFYLIKSELRYPIWKDLEGTLFYDGGSVLVKGFKFADNYRDAAGVGVRYKTPVGALTLDLGYNLDRKQNAPSGRNETEYTGFISFRTY